MHYLLTHMRFKMNFITLSNLIVLVSCSFITACVLPTQVKEITTPRVNPQIKPNVNPSMFKRKRDGSLRLFPFELRTFESTSGTRVEVIGASCKVNSAEFQIIATTPTRVGLPKMDRNASPFLTITCSKLGKKGKLVLPLQFANKTPKAEAHLSDLEIVLGEWMYGQWQHNAYLAVDLN